MTLTRQARYFRSFSIISLLLGSPLRVWLSAGGVLLILSGWALTYAATYRPSRALQATVFNGSDFTQVLQRVNDPILDPAKLAERAGLNPRGAFAVQWDGYAVVELAGRYRIRIASDDGVAIWIDQKLVLDWLAVQGHEVITVPVDLEPGLRPLRIRYVQRGGETSFRLRWADPTDRADFQPVFAVPPSDPPLVFRRVSKALRFPRIAATAWSVWILSGVTLGLLLLTTWATAGSERLKSYPRSALIVLFLTSAWLLLVGITVGLAPERGWALDEITPADVLSASYSGFSNGWSHKYPPLQFYLLALVSLPFTIGQALEWLAFDAETQALIHAVGRALTAATSLLTLLVVAIIGEETIGRRRAVVVGCVLALVPLVVFYGKTTNVDLPSLFWVTVAFLFFIRASKYRQPFDYAGLGLTVALAVATKDQAYAFFPGVAALLLGQSWHEAVRERSIFRRLRLTLLDRRLWLGAAVCLVTYGIVIGVPWNYQGVASHFTLITGTASQPFRMYPASAGGFLQLTAKTAELLPLTLGIVGTALTVAGCVRAIAAPHTYRYLLLLVIPLVSYVVTFLAVVGYVYDRFLLGVVLVAALFAGLGFDWLIGYARDRRVSAIVTVGTLALALAPGVLLNWRMVSDSRLEVERWMVTNLRNDPVVVGVGTQEFLPNLRPFSHYLVIPSTAADVLNWKADVIVLNEQWLDRPHRPGLASLVRELQAAGFIERFASRPSSGTSAIGYLLRGGTTKDPFYSNLTKIDPPLSVWTR